MYERFSEVYDQLMRDVDYDLWAKYLEGLLSENGVCEGDALLECACGTGEISRRLAEKGYRLIATDVSTEMLELAAKKCRSQGLRIPFVQQSMQKLKAHHPVSAVVAACDGVNYLLEEKELLKFFSAAYGALLPGGVFLFDLSSEYKLSTILGMNTFAEDGEDIAYLWKNMYDNKSRLLELNLTFFVRKGALYERFTEQQIQRAYKIEEITRALQSCGFAKPCVYEAFLKRAPTDESERIQFLARKKQ